MERVDKELQNASYFKVLFIDSTMIKNIHGSDLLGKNHFDRNFVRVDYVLLFNNKCFVLNEKNVVNNTHRIALKQFSVQTKNAISNKKMLFSFYPIIVKLKKHPCCKEKQWIALFFVVMDNLF